MLMGHGHGVKIKKVIMNPGRGAGEQFFVYRLTSMVYGLRLILGGSQEIEMYVRPPLVEHPWLV